MTKIEVDEVLGLMSDVGTEVSTYLILVIKILTDNTMPGWVVLLVEFLLDESGNIFLDVELFECLGCNINSILLHV